MKIISTEDCVRVENYIFFIDSECNIVYKMGIEDGIIDVVGSIPEESILAPRLGAKIVYHNDFLYFSPMKAKKIWRFNLLSGEWKGFSRRSYPNQVNGGDMFQAIAYEDSIIFVGCLYPAIVVLDTIGEKLTYIEEPYDCLIPQMQKENDSFFRTDYVQIDGKIYMASCISNEVFIFDLSTYEFEFKSVGEDFFRYSGIAYDGDKFFLAPRKNTPIVIWNGNQGTEYITLPPKFIDHNELIFGGVWCDKDKVVFPACFWDKSIMMDNKKKTISLDIKDESYYFYKTIDDEMIVNLKKNSEMTITYKGKELKYKLEIDEKRIHTYIKNCKDTRLDSNLIVKESECVDLGMLINCMI